jgi:hypothetical protein
MFERYVQMRSHIDWDRNLQHIRLRLTADEDNAVNTVVNTWTTNLAKLVDRVDSEDVKLVLVRKWFAALAESGAVGQAATAYLVSASNTLTPMTRLFVAAVAKVERGRAASLNDDETAALENFGIEVSHVFSESDSFSDAEEMYTTRIGTAPVPSDALLDKLCWIPASTSMIERVFSVLKHVIGQRRHSLNDNSLDNIMLVRLCSDLLMDRSIPSIKN